MDKRGVVPGVLLLLSFLTFSSQEAAAKSKNRDLEQIGSRNINKGQINFLSLEKEIALGRQLAEELERSSRVVDDPEITEYVNRIGQNIVRNSDAQVPFTIKVIESDEVNAMALPGGFFYVNTGLILAAAEEAELAGVLAHEVAHVAARHGTEQYSRGQLFNIASIPLVFMGGPIGYGIRQAAGLLIPLQFLQFGRKAETEADFLGVQYLYKSGYDPTSFIAFFEKVQAQEKRKPGLLARAFSTHPPTTNRIAKAQQEIQEVLPAKGEYVLNTSEFGRIKARLQALENRRVPENEEPNRPALKRKTSGEVDDIQDESPSDSAEERPKLARRPATPPEDPLHN